jgi:hypothetical protein
MRALFVAAALLCSVVAAFAADPVGSYDVKGQNPDGSQYTGSVTVKRTGDTFKVTWQVGNTRYDGTGIGNEKFLAVSYTAGDESGLALYGADGGNWKGIWTYSGGTKMGAEFWSRE